MNSDKKILVSVIVLTFNSASYIGRCLKYLSKQKEKSFEVIVVDAGSSDNTINIIKSYAAKLNIKIVFALNTNMGQARNVGIKKSLGEYVCFCDSDDYFFPNKIFDQLKSLRNNLHFDATYYNAFHFKSNSSKKYLKSRGHVPSKNLLGELIKSQCVNINTLLIKKRGSNGKTVLFPNNKAGKYAEDWQYLLNLCINNYNFLYTKKPLSAVEERTDSHTSEKIQYLMKYHILNYLLLNKQKILLTKKVRLLDFYYYLNIHKIKFIIACFLCDKLDFLISKLKFIGCFSLKYFLIVFYYFFAKRNFFKFLVRFLISYKNMNRIY
jgi:glycosyltransferase involved in cell wall biosynthesis